MTLAHTHLKKYEAMKSDMAWLYDDNKKGHIRDELEACRKFHCFHGNGLTRFEFNDGSAIVVGNGIFEMGVHRSKLKKLQQQLLDMADKSEFGDVEIESTDPLFCWPEEVPELWNNNWTTELEGTMKRNEV